MLLGSYILSKLQYIVNMKIDFTTKLILLNINIHEYLVIVTHFLRMKIIILMF